MSNNSFSKETKDQVALGSKKEGLTDHARLVLLAFNWYARKLIPVFDRNQVKMIVCLMYDLTMDELNDLIVVEMARKEWEK